MAEETKPQAKAEAKPTAKASVNKDGFEKGAQVNEKDYWAHMAKLRAKK